MRNLSRTQHHKAAARLIVAAVVLVSFPACAQVADERLLLVSLPDHQLALIENGEVKQVYPVAVGKESSPSPTGSFRIVARVTDPTYYHPGKVIPAGVDNPLGNRWIGLDLKGYGIHGTNQPQSIGKASSHGCIRMAKRDLEELFARVKVGDTVEIRGERDEQTAGIFGGVTLAAATTQTTDSGDSAGQ